MDLHQPAVILLFGPTGVGKTDLLARLFSGVAEVVSADALQVYKELDIGTAKPDARLLSRIPHHLIDIIDYTQSFSVADFVRRADKAVADILKRGLLPVISGGTAYYLKAWLMGLPETPEVDPEIRRKTEERWKNASDEALAEAVAQVDPLSAQRLGARDRYRMLRVLEVYAQTGRALSSFKVPDRMRTDYAVFSFGLKRDRKELYERINQRVDMMLEQGLEAEVSSLRARGARKEHPGMKAIGYQEWFPEDNSSEEPSLERVRELIARNSRRYAKRQITFFSSLPEVDWYDMSREPEVPPALQEKIDLILRQA